MLGTSLAYTANVLSCLVSVLHSNPEDRWKGFEVCQYVSSSILMALDFFHLNKNKSNMAIVTTNETYRNLQFQQP